MTYNDILRSLRHTLHMPEIKFLEMIRLSGSGPTLEELTAYLKPETDPGFRECGGEVLAACLDGLVIHKRGKQPNRPFLHTPPKPNNNIILKKVRVAFELEETDLIELIGKAGLEISKGELNSFFRSPEHRNYRPCGNQFLRAVLRGLAA